MNLSEVLAANGILRAPEVIELAAAARLDLAAACVLLAKESGGGRNVWGHDPVPTGGTYDKGDEVTRANYTAYRAAVAAGTAKAQGVGPCQLTYLPFADRADAAGGCWDWRANVATGFAILAELIGRYGERDGFRRYNGAGPAAERYADDAVAKLARWRSILSAYSPAPQEEDVPLTQREIEAIADAVWRRPVTNVKGQVVAAEAILAAAEGRAWDTQDRAYDLIGLVRQLADTVAAGGGRVEAAGGTPIDLAALADLLVDRLAARLGGK